MAGTRRKQSSMAGAPTVALAHRGDHLGQAPLVAELSEAPAGLTAPFQRESLQIKNPRVRKGINQSKWDYNLHLTKTSFWTIVLF